MSSFFEINFFVTFSYLDKLLSFVSVHWFSNPSISFKSTASSTLRDNRNFNLIRKLSAKFPRALKRFFRKFFSKKDFSKLLRVVASFSKYRIAMTLKVELPHSFMLSTGNIYFFSKTVFSFFLSSVLSEWEKMRNEKFVLRL